MANSTANQVWVIDTAATSIDATKVGKLKGVRWVGATTAAHAVTIVDGASRILWSSVAAAANNVEADAPDLPFVGIGVTVLDSGKLYLNFG